jgi:hypothetical protein
MLAFVGVPASGIDDERSQMSAMAFGRTAAFGVGWFGAARP